MKLYTEIQMLEAIDRAIFSTDINSFDILEDLTPIELPSDKEIGEQFKNYSENWEIRQALEVGAKWVRDKIQGGDK